MLQNIHDRIQGIVATVIIALICLTFTFWGVQSYIRSHNPVNVVANVDGVEINKEQMHVAYERLRRAQEQRLNGRAITHEMDAVLKKQALEQLINTQVVHLAALKKGFLISNAQAENTLVKIPAFQKDGQFSMEVFNRIMSLMMHTPTSFLAQLRLDLIIGQLQAGIISTAFALPKDVDEAIKLLEQKRAFSFLVISHERFKNKIQMTEEQIKNYYEKNKETFKTPEEVQINYIELSLDDIMKKTAVTAVDAKKYYQNNIAHYTKPIRWKIAYIIVKLKDDADDETIVAAKQKAQQVLKRAKGGEDFAKLARQYSDDKVTAKHGGQLDWFSPGMLAPDLEKAVALLKKPSEISDVVPTKYGLTIIKLLDVERPKPTPYAKLKQKIIKELKRKEAAAKYEQIGEQLANLTFTDPASLEPASRELDLPIKTSEFFSKAGGKTGITKNPRVIGTAYKEDVLSEGNNSDIVQLDSSHVLVLRVKEHKIPKIKLFAEVKTAIKKGLQFDAEKQQVQALGEKVLVALKKDDQSLLVKEHLQWQVQKAVDRAAKGANPLIAHYAFKLATPSKQQPHPLTSFALNNGDYVILRLDKVSYGDAKALDSKQRQLFQQQLANSYGQLEYELFINSLMDKSTIKRFEEHL